MHSHNSIYEFVKTVKEKLATN